MTHAVRDNSILHRIALLATAAPRTFVAIAALATVAAGIFGVPVVKTLCACGFEDPTSESARATQLMTDRFGQGGDQLLIVVSDPAGFRSGPATAVGTDIVGELDESPAVTSVTSAWTTPAPAAAELVSEDGRSGLIVARMSTADGESRTAAMKLSERIGHDRDGVTVRRRRGGCVEEPRVAPARRGPGDHGQGQG